LDARKGCVEQGLAFDDPLILAKLPRFEIPYAVLSDQRFAKLELNGCESCGFVQRFPCELVLAPTFWVAFVCGRAFLVGSAYFAPVDASQWTRARVSIPPCVLPAGIWVSDVEDPVC
jgi:hypothetical protein